jgi:hypothetical protein
MHWKHYGNLFLGIMYSHVSFLFCANLMQVTDLGGICFPQLWSILHPHHDFVMLINSSFFAHYTSIINGPKKQFGCVLYVRKWTLQEFVLNINIELNEHMNLAMQETNAKRRKIKSKSEDTTIIMDHKSTQDLKDHSP